MISDQFLCVIVGGASEEVGYAESELTAEAPRTRGKGYAEISVVAHGLVVMHQKFWM